MSLQNKRKNKFLKKSDPDLNQKKITKSIDFFVILNSHESFLGIYPRIRVPRTRVARIFGPYWSCNVPVLSMMSLCKDWLVLVRRFLVKNLPRSYCYELVVSSKTWKLVELVTFSKSWANILTTIQSVFGYFDLKLTKKMTKMIKKEIYGFIMSLRVNLNMEESVRALLNPIPWVFLSP